MLFRSTAALCGFLGYMCMNSVMGTFLTATGVIDPANLTTGQSTILGITTLDTGVIGGLLVGAIVAWLHNRYYKIGIGRGARRGRGWNSGGAAFLKKKKERRVGEECRSRWTPYH